MATLSRPTSLARPLALGKRSRERLVRIVAFVTLAIGAITMLAPLIYMISTSLKAANRVFTMPPEWIPDPVVWANYSRVWSQVNLAQGFTNSLFVAVVSTTGEVLVSALAGFAFARMRFPGREGFFALLLVTMMLPGVVLMVPSFILFRFLGWIDSFKPLIVPLLFGSAFAVFLCRQFYKTLPADLEDAAKVDGANPWQTFLYIFLPLAKPILVTLAVLGFIARWNDFLGPLIYLNSEKLYTLPLMLARLNGLYERQWHLLMAGSVIAIVPIVLLLLVMQRYLVESVAMTGIKG